MNDDDSTPRGRILALGALVLLGGFAVMVLEIVGARYLQPWFGGAFYVWTSQIGMVMRALGGSFQKGALSVTATGAGGGFYFVDSANGTGRVGRHCGSPREIR